MKAIITVIGQDKVGIIANVSAILAKHQINIIDITQTILQDYFSMMMLVDLTSTDISFAQLKKELDATGDQLGVSVVIQHEDVFKSMHRI